MKDPITKNPPLSEALAHANRQISLAGFILLAVGAAGLVVYDWSQKEINPLIVILFLCVVVGATLVSLSRYYTTLLMKSDR
jgi:uncharacterized integral membrane protein